MMEAERTLARRFGHPRFRPAQRRVVAGVLAGRDVLAVLPTGAGKSVCFQVPALLAPGLTVVVSPLISLIEDQVSAAVGRGLPAAALHSAQGSEDRRAVERDLRSGRLKLLYVSPERLLTRRFLRSLRGVTVTRVAVDEAHCISEWGHDFRPAYRRIGRFRESIGPVQTVALTATATPVTRADIVANLRLREPWRVVARVDRPNLRWETVRARTPAAALERLHRELRDLHGQGIVYLPTRSRTVRLAADLRRRGIVAAAYHAGLAPARRMAVQAGFLGRRVRVACATSAFGMGIDHPDVRAVFHIGLPGSLEAYVQESGRAGRDGAPARCLLYSWPGDGAVQKSFIAAAWPSGRVLGRTWAALPAGRPITQDEVCRSLGRFPAEAVGSALRLIVQYGAARPVYEPRPSGHPAVRYLRGPERLRARLDFAVSRRGRRRAVRRFAAVRRYARTRSCLRAEIASYFGEPPPACGGCGSCAG